MVRVQAPEFGAQAREFRTRTRPPLIPDQPSQTQHQVVLPSPRSAGTRPLGAGGAVDEGRL